MYYTVIKQRQAFENTRKMYWGNTSRSSRLSGVFYHSAIHGLLLLHLLYDIEELWRKTIKHAFSMFYTLIKHGILTNQSARSVLSINIKKSNNLSSPQVSHIRSLQHKHVSWIQRRGSPGHLKYFIRNIMVKVKVNKVSYFLLLLLKIPSVCAATKSSFVQLTIEHDYNLRTKLLSSSILFSRKLYIAAMQQFVSSKPRH